MPVDIHFLRPWVLLLLPLVGMSWFLLRRLPPTDAWQQLLAPHLYRKLLAQQPASNGQSWLLPLMLLLGILAAAGPSWQKMPQPAFQLKRATVLVLDMSMSMRATDIKPNRVTQARFKALDFAKEQLEGEMALLAFAGDAYVISPLTPDHNNISLLLPDLTPEIMPVQGSDFASALKIADQLLQQAGYVKGDIVFFTDGFESQQYTAIRNQLDGYRHRVSVLAFGQTDGAPVQLSNGELLKDARGSIVLPKVPLAQLKDIAALTGGVFAHSTFDDSDVQQLLALPELTLNDNAEQTQMQGDQWQDAGIYLCYVLLAVALWYLRQPQLLVLPLFLLIWPQPVPAHEPPAAAPEIATATADAPFFSWQDLWQSKTAQAKQAYEQGDYATARQRFDDPLWQGNAAYRAGDYAAAGELFKQDSSAAGHYNLGNSLALQQQYEQALGAYQQAEKQQPTLPGLKENIELMKKMLEQQQQSEQNQQQNGDSEQQNGEQKDQQQQDQQNQQSEDQQQSSQDSQQNSEQPADDASTDPAQQSKQESQQQSKQEQAQQAEQDKSQDQPTAQQKAVEQAWPNASAEESQQLENLLRKVQDEPSLLLKNKMLLEYQKRQQQAIPRGVQQEW